MARTLSDPGACPALRQLKLSCKFGSLIPPTLAIYCYSTGNSTTCALKLLTDLAIGVDGLLALSMIPVKRMSVVSLTFNHSETFRMSSFWSMLVSGTSKAFVKLCGDNQLSKHALMQLARQAWD